MPTRETIAGVYKGDFDFFRRYPGSQGNWDENFTDWITKGILVYDGFAYIAVRDFAKIFQKNIEWDEERNRITLIERKHETPLFEKAETAEKIAKAIVEERFSDRVSEKTIYKVYTSYLRRNVTYEVHVKFDSDLFLKDEDKDDFYADAIVKINQSTWQIVSIEFWDDEEEYYISIDSIE
ncbi:MAG: hypothetical protein E7399_04770 [Ruminococcaceae bacterium]|nr:hypothetical protein [Oscillospiraceae bacterium]